MPLMALDFTRLREIGKKARRVTLEEGSRRRTTEAGTVNHHALTHNLSIDVHDEYSGGSVPLMALEDMSLREMGEWEGAPMS